MDNKNIPPALWTSIAQGCAVFLSVIWLIQQRIKSIRLDNDSIIHTKEYTKRDVTDPFSNGSRPSRILFGTAVIQMTCIYILVSNTVETGNPTHVYIAHLVSLVCHLYGFVLGVTAYRFPFPSNWGWALNMQLFFIYSVSLTTSTINLITVLWENPTIPARMVCPYILILALSLDISFTTAATKKGQSFLDEKDKKVNGFSESSILGHLYFNWMTPIIDLANRNGARLANDDLPTLPSTLRAFNLYYIFKFYRDRKSSLFYKIYRTNRKYFLIQTTLSILGASLFFVSPYCLNNLLLLIESYTQGDNRIILKGFGYVCVMGLNTVVISLVKSQLWFYAESYAQLRVKAMLNLEIYRKTLRRPDVSILSGKTQENGGIGSNMGRVVNLMSTDANRISAFLSWWFSILTAPTQIIIGIYFLYSLLGWACLLGLLVMVVFIPCHHVNVKMLTKAEEKMMGARDQRVSLMNEALQGIRQIKFFAWEKRWEKRILETRTEELKHLKTIRISEAIFNIFWNGIPLLVTVISFFAFTFLRGKELTPPIAFTSITIFTELRFALNILPDTVVMFFQALVSIRRVEAYLNEKEIDPPPMIDYLAPVKIGFENATVSWIEYSASGEHDPSNDLFKLKNINIKFPNGDFSIICGPTGSGKTLLMLSLLGETQLVEGNAYCPLTPFPNNLKDASIVNYVSPSILQNTITPSEWILSHSIAYVSQVPWLQNVSIKDNILFGLPMIPARYKETLSCCALDKDISYLDNGDNTEIGERGITLSGGQKARVALARAVYSRAQNILMDDILSSVDSHTAKHIYQTCLMGPIMKGRTRILITHQVNLCIPGSKYIVYVNHGGVEMAGCPKDFVSSGKLNVVVEECNTETGNEEHGALENTSTEKKSKALVEEEGRESGTVKYKHYKAYLSRVGGLLFWIIVLFIFISVRSLDIASTYWLKEWTRYYESSSISRPTWAVSSLSGPLSTNQYLAVYAGINSLTLLLITVRFSVVFWGGLKASKTIYVELLHRVFRSPLRFFDKTPVGRILNRFSKDFDTIDIDVAPSTAEFIFQALQAISIVFVAVSVLPIFVIPMLLLVAINIVYGKRFTNASREFNRISSVSRSPLFNHFSETIAGISTVRAFGISKEFMLDMIYKIDFSSRPMYYGWIVTRWISVRVSGLGALVSFFVATVILFNLDHIDAATTGFCLNYVLLFSDMTFWGVRRYTELEMNFNAVERVVEFMELEEEAPTITDKRPPKEWPLKGAIKVDNLHVRYASDLNPVLKGISFTVKPQEKIGIVGRTGSGKSTLALSFFRFVEAFQGSITIDGIDISEIGTQDLRSNLTIVPQDLVLFSGTLRGNMDPFDQFSDQEIYTAFRRVQLLSLEEIDQLNQSASVDDSENNKNLFKDLETRVTEGGTNFSQGQRQLLCLARALLKRNRVVIMDEATASIDHDMDGQIQDTIRQEFPDCTLLTIAHRLKSVVDYDRILVIDNGSVIEVGTPYDLIQANGAFRSMCENSGEFEVLLQMATLSHQQKQ